MLNINVNILMCNNIIYNNNVILMKYRNDNV